MPQLIFVNLPVKDLETSKAFFGKLGYSCNPQFSDENTACLVISDTIFAMLLTEPRFKQFTKKEIARVREGAKGKGYTRVGVGMCQGDLPNLPKGTFALLMMGGV